jgi:hypothetical protein
MNANLPHRVANEGNSDRIHLIVDCDVNHWLSSLITQSDKISIKEENTDNDLLMIISELRRQNTATSDKLAIELEKQLKGPTSNNEGF